MEFTELMVRAASGGDIDVPDSWMQGRTLSGGLATALCCAAVVAEHSLPPLRSASVNFIGPSSGTVRIQTQLLRKGKSVCQIQADLYSGENLATRIVFVFGASRDSQLNMDRTERPECLGVDPESVTPLRREGPGVAQFSQYFDARAIAGGLAENDGEITDHWVWMRHLDKSASDIAALLMIADSLPPTALSWLPWGTPASSISWLINIVVDNPTTQDGWWLLGNVADQAQSGYSSQNMMIWSRTGQLVATGRQSVIVFA